MEELPEIKAVVQARGLGHVRWEGQGFTTQHSGRDTGVMDLEEPLCYSNLLPTKGLSSAGEPKPQRNLPDNV